MQQIIFNHPYSLIILNTFTLPSINTESSISNCKFLEFEIKNKL